MSGFAVAQAAPIRTERAPPGGLAPKPVGSLEAVSASYSDSWETVRLNARWEREQARLWERHQAIEKATGRKIQPSFEMLDTPRDPYGSSGDGIAGGQANDAYEAEIERLRTDFPAAMQAIQNREALRAAVGAELGDIRSRAENARTDHPVAGFIGSSAGIMADPMNTFGALATGGLGASRPLLMRMGVQGLANAGIEAVQTPLRMTEAQVIGGPEMTGEEAILNIGMAGVGGAAFEAVSTGIGKALSPLFRPRAAQVADTLARDDAAIGAGADGETHQAAAAALQEGRPPPPPALTRDIFERPAAAGETLDYGGRRVMLENFDPATLRTDAPRFQYKEGGDAEGVTARLKGVEVWDPIAAGQVMVWEDRAGARFVADGHQRFGLVRRLNDVEGFENTLSGWLFREADGWSARDVRVMAALKNLREGSGSIMDAAKVFRDAPDLLKDRSLPVTGEFIANARGLAQLSDEAFKAAVNKVIDERFAADIGAMAPGRKDLHMDMVRLIREAEPANLDENRALIAEALQDDWIRTQGEQADMFGYDPSVSAMIARAKVAAAVKRALARDARLYGLLVRNAEAIEAGGNALARDANEARLAMDRTALSLVAKLSLRSGPLGETMAEAARAVTAGSPPGLMARPVLARVRELIEAGETFAAERGELVDPQPPAAVAEAVLKDFDEPAGEGAKAQAESAPENAALEAGDDVPGLFDDLAGDDLYTKAHTALTACAPGPETGTPNA